jgi:hypothetical protein
MRSTTDCGQTRTPRGGVVLRASALALLLLYSPRGPVPADATAGANQDALAALLASTDRNTPVEIDWRTLAGLNYRTGEMTEQLKKIDGQLVRIPGFVVPLEDYVESAAEFLLVPYFGACVHVPPPPPNQRVYVEMEGRREARFGWWEPIWLEGRLKITTVESPYGVVGFTLDGQKVEPYKE